MFEAKTFRSQKHQKEMRIRLCLILNRIGSNGQKVGQKIVERVSLMMAQKIN